jgi:hypothetical protein
MSVEWPRMDWLDSAGFCFVFFGQETPRGGEREPLGTRNALCGVRCAGRTLCQVSAACGSACERTLTMTAHLGWSEVTEVTLAR